MRINKFVARATGMSRRAVDAAISEKRVSINGTVATLGQAVTDQDNVKLDGREVSSEKTAATIMLNKPAGYVCSRNGQGSKTIYDLLPIELHHLKPVGRLDKDSSGLLLLTNDGDLSNKLTHPKHQKTKIYHIELDRPLSTEDKSRIESGVLLEDGISKLKIKQLENGTKQQVTMHEGRNRQIRRTFAAFGYKITNLHRIQFGSYKLKNTAFGEWQNVL